ncbi:MAG: diacylglycerol kinase family protein [Ferruginibacter sp.]|jgi:hypothetical protein
MKENKPFRISDRVKSFGYAFEGIVIFFRTQHNAWIHLLATVFVIITGFFLKINASEWCWITSAIIIVIITEMLNTAIEFMCDTFTLDNHPQIKKIKDIAAGAVLIAALGALVIGCLILIPNIIALMY